MTLAIHGGTPVRTEPFPSPPGFGYDEREAANHVLNSGVLSGFRVGGDAFYGGPQVRALEAAWQERFKVKHAVTVNSATSALDAAVQAVGVKPGDEVIVSPWTMSASVACVLASGGIPVFADIEPVTFGLDPDSVHRLISPKTKAIIIVDLFGCVPAGMESIQHLATDYGLALIEDASQTPGATDQHGNFAGTLGDIGVFSLNIHKTIQCGEGGVAATNDDRLAERLMLVRNHGEAVVAVRGPSSKYYAHQDIIGHNWRMGEIEAAIATVQLGRLEELTRPRIRIAEWMTAMLNDLEGLTLPVVPEGLRHVFYLYAVRTSIGGFLEALQAEGIPASRYVPPIYGQPIHRNSRPTWNGCPEAERAYREVFTTPLVHAEMTDQDVMDVMDGFRKVHAELTASTPPRSAETIRGGTPLESPHA